MRTVQCSRNGAAFQLFSDDVSEHVSQSFESHQVSDGRPGRHWKSLSFILESRGRQSAEERALQILFQGAVHARFADATPSLKIFSDSVVGVSGVLIDCF